MAGNTGKSRRKVFFSKLDNKFVAGKFTKKTRGLKSNLLINEKLPGDISLKVTW